MVLRYYLIALIFGWITTCCQGQCLSGKEQNNWAYRNTIIGFNDILPSITPYTSNGSYELNTQWCDSMGQVLLYVHSNRVFNRNHQLMPLGNNLGIGNAGSSTHGIILPWPGNDSLYFLFIPESHDSHTGPKTLFYAVVDMSLDGGLGAVIGSNPFFPDKFPFLTMSSERVAAVRHCNGRDWWLLGRSADSNAWYAWPITPDGIQAPVVSHVGFQTIFQTGPICTSSGGQLHISPDGRKLAVVYARTDCTFGSDSTLVELLDFSTSTGVVSLANTIYHGIGYSYGVQFSPDNAFLYYSWNQFNGRIIYQVDLLTPGLPYQQVSPPPVIPDAFINIGGGMATGPDGRIYVTDFPNSWLHVIADPNELGDNCNFLWKGLDISPGTSGLGLPTMPTGYWRPYAPWLSGQRRPRPCDTLTYTVSHTCSADTWTEWRYRGANTLLSEDADSVRIVFHTPGTDTLIATRHSPCDVVSDTILLQVQPPPVLKASLSDSLLCPGSIATLIIAPEAITRQLILPDGSVMSNLPDTLALGPITEDACYTLILGAEGACDTMVSFCLRSLSTATTIDTLILCAGESTQIHGSTVSIPGTYDMTYTAANGCDSLSSVTLQIISTLEVVADVSPPTCAGLSDGYILLDAGPGMSYVWNDGADISSRQNLPSGNYTVTISAGASCDTVLTFILTAPPEVSVTLPSSSNVLEGDSLHLQPLIHPPGAYTYLWTPEVGLNCADCPDPIAAPTSTTAYTLIVTDALGCTYSAGTLLEVRDPETPVQHFYFPTAFSPNEDGVNDTWQILGGENLVINRLEVFDRWGNLVHACSELLPSLCIWDGTTLGKKSPAGIYVWQIELTLPDGTLLKRKGEMMLVR